MGLVWFRCYVSSHNGQDTYFITQDEQKAKEWVDKTNEGLDLEWFEAYYCEVAAQ